MKIILLNGPPRSGKDTAAEAIISAVASWGGCPLHEKFSAPNKRAFAGMMNALMVNFDVTPYEAQKEEIIPSLGVSYRQWQIDYSEKFMKPLYGIDVLGRLLIGRLIDAEYNAPYDVAVVSDCGFQIEVDALWKSGHFQGRDMLLIRCHRDGCYFVGDNREMVDTEWFANYNLANNGTVEQWKEKIVHVVGNWLKHPGSDLLDKDSILGRS